MNKHLNDGQLRAVLDGELDSDELRHLESCVQCQSHQKIVETQMRSAAERLSFLSSSSEAKGLSTSAAWQKFNNRKLAQKETNMLRKLFAFPLVKYGIPVLLIFTLIFAIPGTRALASELLNLFRVQQVAIVPVDFTGMEQLDGAVGSDISQLISDSITMT